MNNKNKKIPMERHQEAPKTAPEIKKSVCVPEQPAVRGNLVNNIKEMRLNIAQILQDGRPKNAV